MFELPDAKRVRRTELHCPSSSPEPSEQDEEYDSLLKAKLASLYGPIFDTATSPKPPIEKANADPAINGRDEGAAAVPEEGLEFRLFASAPAFKRNNADEDVISHPIDGGGITKITLEPDDDGALDGPGGFVVPQRNSTYYFSARADGQQRREFELAAVTGEEVRRWLGVRYTGWEVPWRVRVIRVASKKASEEARLRLRDRNDGSRISALEENDADVVVEERKKKKLGKKRRIILRKKKRAEEEVRERKRRERQMREEGQKEKRTKKNREKKVKKRMRDKAKKVAAGGAGSGIREAAANAGSGHSGGDMDTDSDGS